MNDPIDKMPSVQQQHDWPCATGLAEPKRAPGGQPILSVKYVHTLTKAPIYSDFSHA